MIPRVVLALALTASTLEAQSVTTASPFVPPGHWSYAVLRRMDAAGLLPAGADVARRTITHAEISSLLSGEYLHHFQEEFDVARPLLGSSTIFAELREHEMRAGVGYDTVWVPGEVGERETDKGVLARLTYSSTYLAGAAALGDDGVEELQVIATAGAIGVWGGKRALGYRVAHGGGVAVDNVEINGAGAFLTRPVRIPLLGPFRFETHVSKIDNVLNFENTQRNVEPWFWTARGSFEPHTRLRVGVTRGMIFGGEGNVPVTASRLLKNLLGIYTSDGENSFANQLVSVDFRYRAPTGRLPMTLYVDWGSDDAYGAWWRVPGIVGGVEFSALPARDVSVGVERAEFVRNTTTNSNWYQNAWFRGGWTDDGELLAHSLGGHGLEWRAFATAGSATLGLSGDAAIFTRHRRDQNLFSPTRQGKSAGASLNANVRMSPSLRLLFEGEIERGESGSWTASQARAGARFVF